MAKDGMNRGDGAESNLHLKCQTKHVSQRYVTEEPFLRYLILRLW